MSCFDTVGGQEMGFSISHSLQRLADAAEESNRLKMAELAAKYGADWLGNQLTKGETYEKKK